MTFDNSLPFVVVSREHDIKIDNKTSESVEQFKHSVTALTNQNSIQESLKAD
jgi:hypothetical protein